MNMSDSAVQSPATTTKPVRPWRSLNDALDGHRNSLGLIRLVLASIVLIDHAFPLTGRGKDPFWELTHAQASLGSLAVAGFFAISGYLIAKSGLKGDVIQFMWRRTLRIFPAYWVLLIVTAFVFGPILWKLAGGSLGEYFAGTPAGATPYYFVTGNWTLEIHSYGIYNIFVETTPYGQSVHGSAMNGSIWTLIYEWRAYLIIAVLVTFGILTRARIIVPILMGIFLTTQIVMGLNPSILAASVPNFMTHQYMVNLGFTFLVGSTLAVYAKKIPYDHGLGLFTGVILVASLRWGGFGTVGLAAGAYFVLYLAAVLPTWLQWIGQKNDYSYGVYIYGFFVQQTLAYFGIYHWGFVPYVALSWVGSMILAWLSWHAVEKWAMRLKDWGPGRGVQYWRLKARRRV
jgi:peptidoglycan/LPS O-acetylase OafA/YrhL